jgi:hypothetical protein
MTNQLYKNGLRLEYSSILGLKMFSWATVHFRKWRSLEVTYRPVRLEAYMCPPNFCGILKIIIQAKIYSSLCIVKLKQSCCGIKRFQSCYMLIENLEF